MTQVIWWGIVVLAYACIAVYYLLIGRDSRALREVYKALREAHDEITEQRALIEEMESEVSNLREDLHWARDFAEQEAATSAWYATHPFGAP